VAGVGAGIAGGALFGAKLGGTLGTFAGPLGTLVGAAAGVLVGSLVGAGIGALASNFNKDATSQEKEAMDALYEAYKEQGDAALTDKGIREALSKVGIDDENLIQSLAKNDKATRELMQAMEANTAAVNAETLSIATQ
jgi:phage tail tape-measure protein